MDFKKYQRLWFTVANNVVRNHQDAEDVVQESMIKMVRFKDQCTGNEKSWSCKIVHRTALNYIRGRKPMVNIDDVAIPDNFDIEEEIDNRLLSRKLVTAIEGLPYRYKSVVKLVHSGFKLTDASKELQIEYGCCKARKREGVKKLQKKLKYLK